MRKLQAELGRRPEKRQGLGRHGHRQGDWQLDLTATLDRAQSGRPQIRAAQPMLAVKLDAVELEVELEIAAPRRSRQPGDELFLVGDANAVGVEQNVVNPWIILNPAHQFEKLRMQRRFATGQLQNLNAALAIHDALNPPLQILQRHRIHFVSVARWRVGITGRATQIARVDDFDQRETGGEFLERRVAPARRVSPQRASGRAIGGATRRTVTTDPVFPDSPGPANRTARPMRCKPTPHRAPRRSAGEKPLPAGPRPARPPPDRWRGRPGSGSSCA